MGEDNPLVSLLRWFSVNTSGGQLIEAGDIPTLPGAEEIDFDGSMDDLRSALKNVKFPSKRSFDLGSVTTGLGLMQSSASHRTVRQKGGTSWAMYMSGPDFPEGEVYMDTISSTLVLTEVSDLGYELTLSDWISMGWRPD